MAEPGSRTGRPATFRVREAIGSCTREAIGSCADDLEAVCTGRLAGQESLAVATFKSLQAGSASHLRRLVVWPVRSRVG